MMIYLDDYTLADEVPAADAVEQQQPVDVSVEDAGLDPGYVTNLLQRDANPLDVIDQAIIVPTTTATSTPPGSKRREQRRLRRHVARRGPTGSGRQGAPTQRGRPRTRRRRRPGTPGFGPGHQCISQTPGAQVMGLRGLHDLDKRLVECVAPQRDEHAFGGVADPRPRTARILRPARRVRFARTSWIHPYPNAHHITCSNRYIFPHDG